MSRSLPTLNMLMYVMFPAVVFTRSDLLIVPVIVFQGLLLILLRIEKDLHDEFLGKKFEGFIVTVLQITTMLKKCMTD